MARSPMKVASENDVTPPAKESLDFDDENLRAIAQVYLNEGNDEHRKKDFFKAIHFYTEGIKVNCKDDELNAKLYSNRATAHIHLGNYEDSLSDARAATDLQPTFLKAIERGTTACMKLNRFGEAITWCDKGLAIHKNNKKLLELRTKSVKEQSKQQKPDGEKTEKSPGSHTVKGTVGDLKRPKKSEVGGKVKEERSKGNLGNVFLTLADFRKAIAYYELQLKTAKEVGDKSGEGRAYGNLGFVFRNLGDFKKAKDCHELHLKIAKEVGDKAGEGTAYGNLGIAFGNLGDFRKAIGYQELHLKFAKQLGDKASEGTAYGNLGIAFGNLGDFKKAIDYFELRLKIAKEVGDKTGTGSAYGNLGNAFSSLGDFRKAIDYYELRLKIAKEVQDKAGEGHTYGNLGSAFVCIGDFKKAVDYFELNLKIAKDLGDKATEGKAYGNLGTALCNLGDFRKGIDYFKLDLKIAKAVGNKVSEGKAYGNLGNAFLSLGDFKKALDYQELHLKIAKEVGDKDGEATASHSLGFTFETLGFLPKAFECYECSVRLFNYMRYLLQCKDTWKIIFRNKVDTAYTGLWRVMLKQDRWFEALFTAEKGRAQALTDLMLAQFGVHESPSMSQEGEEQYVLRSYIPSNTVFQAFNRGKIHFWVLSKQGPIRLREKEIGEAHSVLKDGIAFLQSLIKNTFRQIRVYSEVRCENRSFDVLRDIYHKRVDESEEEKSEPITLQESSLSTLYNILIQPIADLVQGDELIIVPDGPLWLAPYAALVDENSKYLCESFRIRLIPSLTSLKLLADCPDEYHHRSGALVVGDPWVEEVTNSNGEKFLDPLPSARKEVEMIGQILNVTPLIGKKATKCEVLKGLNSVALVHIAAHGCMETGEIALTPDPKRASRIPTKEDYVLTIQDVLSVKLRARLVVLSCCHSGRGEIKAEGVVGIARAFLGAGARSVLVSLWAIDDEATLEFMKRFYHHLVKGESASESLNQAMKSLKESDKYSDVRYWAPFVLIGDDVTLDDFH